MLGILRTKRGWAVFIFAVLLLFAGYWPVQRLEIAEVREGISRYYSLPPDRTFQVVYRNAGRGEVETRTFRVGRDGKIRLVETIYDPAPVHAGKFYDPKRVSRRGTALIVRGGMPPFPALHLVLSSGSERILRLGKEKKIDLSTLFPVKAVITLKVVGKPLLFYLWNRYTD